MKFSAQIHTHRLWLRPLQTKDFWFFSRLVGNQEVRRYLGGTVGWKQRLANFKRYLTAPDYVGIWVVILADGKQPVGLVELGPHKDGKDYEISYQFNPNFWGNGYAHEAVQAILRHALNECDMERIIAETQSANTASCRVLANQGMVELERVQRFGAEQIIFRTN